MQTTTDTTSATTTTERDQILTLMETFIRSRPGLEFANYGDVSAYRSEQRAITRDRDHALTLLRYVRWTSIDAAALRAAFRDAYSGRLSLECTRDWECLCGNHWSAPVKYAGEGEYTSRLSGELTEWCPKCHHRPLTGSPHKLRLHYTAGQYYPTEYRRAACAVLAAAIWDYWRDNIIADRANDHPSTQYLDKSVGDALRAKARAEFGPAIARRWFN